MKAKATNWADVEATSIIEDFSAQSPYALASELGIKRDVYDEGADFALAVAKVLRSRQAEWQALVLAVKHHPWSCGADADFGARPGQAAARPIKEKAAPRGTAIRRWAP